MSGGDCCVGSVSIPVGGEGPTCGPVPSTMHEKKPIYREKHVRYFLSCLNGLTFHYAGHDQNRLMVAYFCIVGLDILGALNQVPKKKVIDWIYYLQLDQDDCHPDRSGFRGSTWFMRSSDGAGAEYDSGHIAMAYVALASLRTLGDDYSRVNRDMLVAALKASQQEDGSFMAFPEGNERDMRFLFCACAVSWMLDDWRGVDVERAVGYIRACRSFDGGIALLPGQESHGGSTFCAMAALTLMAEGPGSVGLTETEREELLHWCINRQIGGFQGRSNKDPDTCYSFWIGATLALLGRFDVVNCERAREFHLSCLDMRFGGFAKYPGMHSDVVHAFYSVCFLSMSGEPGFRPLDCALAVCADKGRSVESEPDKGADE